MNAEPEPGGEELKANPAEDNAAIRSKKLGATGSEEG